MRARPCVHPFLFSFFYFFYFFFFSLLSFAALCHACSVNCSSALFSSRPPSRRPLSSLFSPPSTTGLHTATVQHGQQHPSPLPPSTHSTPTPLLSSTPLPPHPHPRRPLLFSDSWPSPALLPRSWPDDSLLYGVGCEVGRLFYRFLSFLCFLSFGLLRLLRLSVSRIFWSFAIGSSFLFVCFLLSSLSPSISVAFICSRLHPSPSPPPPPLASLQNFQQPSLLTTLHLSPRINRGVQYGVRRAWVLL